jgi:hypothetical protein
MYYAEPFTSSCIMLNPFYHPVLCWTLYINMYYAEPFTSTCIMLNPLHHPVLCWTLSIILYYAEPFLSSCIMLNPLHQHVLCWTLYIAKDKHATNSWTFYIVCWTKRQCSSICAKIIKWRFSQRFTNFVARLIV